MATGLLVVMTGRATRLAQYLGEGDKTYLAEITFGVVSDTYDSEGLITETGVRAPSDMTLIHRALERFRGRFQQTPPAISAKKVNGVAAYKLARKRIPVDLKPVEVEVKRLEIQSLAPEMIELLVTCSAGTYIRSIAHDLGQQLGCGAVLSKLRRLQSGEFTLEQARTLEESLSLPRAVAYLRQSFLQPASCRDSRQSTSIHLQKHKSGKAAIFELRLLLFLPARNLLKRYHIQGISSRLVN